MNKGYTYSDMPDIKRRIIKHVPGGLLLECGHICYFGNPSDFEEGNLFYCYECPFGNIVFKIIEKSEINVSDNLQVGGQHLKDNRWSNN